MRCVNAYLIFALGYLFVYCSEDDICWPVQEIILNREESVNISSPGFETFNYPMDALCSWTIMSRNGTNRKLLVDFTLISIWPSYNCLFDGVILFDGNSTSSPILGKYCSGTPSKHINTSGPSLHILFYSSDMANYPFRGFSIQITEVGRVPKCLNDEKTCHNEKCVSLKYLCDGNDDCGDGTDEEECGYRVRHSVSCGLTAISPEIGNEDRIVGGRAAIPGSWPWQVSVRLKNRPLYGHRCGGVLINDQWIITAAHCFRESRNISLWIVYLGKYFKEKHDETEQMRYIREIVVHPKYAGYNSNTSHLSRKDNDIALIRLNAPVTMTDYVHPICLPPWRIEIPNQTLCHVTGWGETLGTGNSDVLKQAAVPVTSIAICRKSYSNFQISNRMLCAGFPQGGIDSCKGDSGGPLVVQKKGHWFLIGIVSTGGSCAFAMQPGVYTKVSFFKIWISRIVWTHT